jgi:hypothetical protein
MVTQEAAVDGGAAGRGAGATRVYVCPRREQLFLMPVSMLDWVPEGHLAWFVLEVVGEWDTSALHRRPGGAPGRPPGRPRHGVAVEKSATTPRRLASPPS